ACYPRGSFYPLSDGPSMRNHRITKSYFRTCSTCKSRSQALFCLYTLRMISNHSERTFERLRYSLGGDRPSQTAYLKLSPNRITVLGSNVHTARVVSHGCLHDSQRCIRRMPSRTLALTFLRLPPILYTLYKHSISAYGKAPRGLSALSRVMRVFTHSIISPGLSLRQCSSRCIFRAGRNLPDKE